MKTLSATDKMADLLVQRGRLTETDKNRLLGVQQKTGKTFFQLLMEEKIADENEISRLLSDVTGIPLFNLTAYQIDKNLTQILPKKIAERYEVIPVSKMGHVLTIATSKLLDLIVLDDIKGLTGCDIRMVLAPPAEIQHTFNECYLGTSALKEVLQEAGSEQVEIISQEEEGKTAEPSSGNVEAPIVRMVAHIVQEAVNARASDIHFEPYQDIFRIRFRIDGVLKETFQHSLEIYPAVIARIKILSNLDITERRVPQDGRFKTHVGDKEVDFRVSVLPTFFGEKAVLRILDKANVRAGLNDLGFMPGPIQAFQEAIKHPYGMILVTGPTGSGKSTTLYSVLNLLNTPDRNLMTVEDPIEYQVEGITQTQTNAEIGLNFASGLRCLLRQSPDVILVGEIRDTETADIAVKAALTGHLVLSTLHTNSASGAVTRLIDMGVEPFLIASSVILVAAQRLLRRICSYCKGPVQIPPEVLKRVALRASDLKDVTAYKGKGCSRCNGTGYHGRLGAIEVLTVDSEIRQAILARASSEDVEKMARKKGMETLYENALSLFRTGKTTLEEVLRVTAVE